MRLITITVVLIVTISTVFTENAEKQDPKNDDLIEALLETQPAIDAKSSNSTTGDGKLTESEAAVVYRSLTAPKLRKPETSARRENDSNEFTEVEIVTPKSPGLPSNYFRVATAPRTTSFVTREPFRASLSPSRQTTFRTTITTTAATTTAPITATEDYNSDVEYRSEPETRVRVDNHRIAENAINETRDNEFAAPKPASITNYFRFSRLLATPPPTTTTRTELFDTENDNVEPSTREPQTERPSSSRSPVRIVVRVPDSNRRRRPAAEQGTTARRIRPRVRPAVEVTTKQPMETVSRYNDANDDGNSLLKSRGFPFNFVRVSASPRTTLTPTVRTREPVTFRNTQTTSTATTFWTTVTATEPTTTTSFETTDTEGTESTVSFIENHRIVENFINKTVDSDLLTPKPGLVTNATLPQTTPKNQFTRSGVFDVEYEYLEASTRTTQTPRLPSRSQFVTPATPPGAVRIIIRPPESNRRRRPTQSTSKPANTRRTTSPIIETTTSRRPPPPIPGNRDFEVENNALPKPPSIPIKFTRVAIVPRTTSTATREPLTTRNARPVPTPKRKNNTSFNFPEIEIVTPKTPGIPINYFRVSTAPRAPSTATREPITIRNARRISRPTQIRTTAAPTTTTTRTTTTPVTTTEDYYTDVEYESGPDSRLPFIDNHRISENSIPKNKTEFATPKPASVINFFSFSRSLATPPPTTTRNRSTRPELFDVEYDLEPSTRLPQTVRPTSRPSPPPPPPPPPPPQPQPQPVDRSRSRSIFSEPVNNRRRRPASEVPVNRRRPVRPIIESTTERVVERFSDAEEDSNTLPNVRGIAGEDYPIYATIPQTNFVCKEMEFPGFYADMETGCQIYHSCHHRRGLVHSFMCPNGTIFSQEYLICDWWYNVKCGNSDKYYSVNREAFSSERKKSTNSTLTAFNFQF